VAKVFYKSTIGDGIFGEPFFPLDLAPMAFEKEAVDKRYPSGECPAQKEYYKNTWVFRSPFSFSCKFMSDEHEKSLVFEGMHADAVPVLFTNKHIYLNTPLPEFQISIFNYLWTDSPNVWVEQIPAEGFSRSGAELVCGTFPISSWVRPLSIGLRMTGDELKVEKGDPLFRVRLIDKANDDKIRLYKSDEMPERVRRVWEQGGRFVKYNKKKSWPAIINRVRQGIGGKKLLGKK
jgi:hypothetical protein